MRVNLAFFLYMYVHVWVCCRKVADVGNMFNMFTCLFFVPQGMIFKTIPRVYLHKCSHIRVFNLYMHACLHCMYARIYAYTASCIHTNLNIQIDLFMRTHTHAYTYEYTCNHNTFFQKVDLTRTWIYMNARILQTLTHTCTETRIRTYTITFTH